MNIEYLLEKKEYRSNTYNVNLRWNQTVKRSFYYF